LIRNPYAQIASELRIDARNPERSKAHFKRRIEQILEDDRFSHYQGIAREAQKRDWVFQMALVWRVSNEEMLRDSLLDKRLVVYEQLCREPLTVVTDLFGFLGWPVSDQTVEYLRQTTEVSPSEAESGNFSLRKNADESLNRWRAELDEQTYESAREALEGSDLLKFWSPEELSLSA
jgi:hypothetical protein